jgi:hypothetical protein
LGRLERLPTDKRFCNTELPEPVKNKLNELLWPNCAKKKGMNFPSTNKPINKSDQCPKKKTTHTHNENVAIWYIKKTNALAFFG